jgi:rare lipoprotein A
MTVAPAAASRFAPTTIIRTCTALVLIACVSACASHPKGSTVASRGAYKVGAPYTIDGVTYVPQEEFNHVETGVASWYGPGFHGKSTANGERYDQSDHTAAHRTLQMPAIVRVTNLDNGRSTVVRINDRGPYARNRIIDLSRSAAQELDVVGKGTARVRLDQLPAESMAVKEVALGGGGPAEQRDALVQVANGSRNVPPTMVAASTPVPVTPPAPLPPIIERPAGPAAPSDPSRATIASIAAGVSPQTAGGGGGFYVQTGAFTTVDKAERQRELVRSYGASDIYQASAAGRDVYRVRIGPYTTPDAAGIVADRLKRSGYGDARVVAD